MENNKVIKLEEAFVKEVEEADYNYSTKKDVVALFINNGLDTTNAAFVAYQRDMAKAYAEFNKLKSKIEKAYVISEYPDQIVNWNLDYDTCELTIKVVK